MFAQPLFFSISQLPVYQHEEMIASGWKPHFTGERIYILDGIFERVIYCKKVSRLSRAISCMQNSSKSKSVKEGLVKAEKLSKFFFTREFKKIKLINEDMQSYDFKGFMERNPDSVFHYPETGHSYIALILPTFNSSIFIFGYRGVFDEKSYFINYINEENRTPVSMQALHLAARNYCEMHSVELKRRCY